MNERDLPLSPIDATKTDNPLHGVELMRKATRLAGNTRESTWDGLTAREVLTVCATVLQCGWDVTPCDLTDREWKLALAGKVAPLGAALQKRADEGKL